MENKFFSVHAIWKSEDGTVMHVPFEKVNREQVRFLFNLFTYDDTFDSDFLLIQSSSGERVTLEDIDKIVEQIGSMR